MCELTGCGNHQHLPPIELSSEDRRRFLKGLATLPLATVLAYPDLARAAAANTESVSITTKAGKQVSAAIARPDAENAPAILLIHEWWGLNDHIKSVAVEFARQGYIALAVDLYDGNVATEPDAARSLMQAVDVAVATDTLVSWVDYLRSHTGANGKVGTVGWCFGGGWSLNTSLATAVDATVIYYGNVKKESNELAALNSPVLGHFATKDGWINHEMVDGFTQAMQSAGKAGSMTLHWYDADHAFANPTSARYDAEDAALSWERTTAFFKQHLS